MQTSANVGSEAATAGAGASAIERIGAAVLSAAPLVIEVAALGALAYGCYLAWQPLGFIVPGGSVFALSIVADFRKPRS